MTQDTQQSLIKHVKSIADDIDSCNWGESVDYVEGDEGDNVGTAIDWLSDVLDIQWIINRDKELLGARILVSFGGPNIWVNTQTSRIEGYWWNESAEAFFSTNHDLNDALEEIYNC